VSGGGVTWLLKPAELALKGGNRRAFEVALRRNLRTMLAGRDVRIDMTRGRFYVYGGEGDRSAVEGALDRLAGIAGWAEARVFPKTPEAILAACADEGFRLAARGISTFKIEAHRTDKSFPLDSYALRCKAGDAVCEAVPSLAVDVRNPGAVIRIEVREKVYVYSDSRRGLGGLPVGTAGRGMLLLSGGIDSPVAGFMMATRGMELDAAHFHTYPYTSAQARDKVARLAGILAGFCPGLRLHSVCLTAVQARIKDGSPAPWATVLLRMAMMECAERIALTLGCRCLITGESLSQVASQTVENLACTQSRVSLPVFRPLIGTDKEGIIRKAERIGTYATSIEPHDDCCALFSPPHPILRGDPAEAGRLYAALELEPLIAEALAGRETARVGDE